MTLHCEGSFLPRFLFQKDLFFISYSDESSLEFSFLFSVKIFRKTHLYGINFKPNIFLIQEKLTLTFFYKNFAYL